jgi:hypothetical protein
MKKVLVRSEGMGRVARVIYPDLKIEVVPYVGEHEVRVVEVKEPAPITWNGYLVGPGWKP